MKIVIYLAGALLLFATAFGLSDYFKAKKHGTLVNYTEEPPAPAPVLKVIKPDSVTVQQEGKAVKKLNPVEGIDTTKKAAKKKVIRSEMFSRGRISE
jgi:hypothetical protein